MKTRLIAGIVGLSILLPLIVWGGALAVQGVVFGALVICALEFANMAFPGPDRNLSLAWLLLGTLSWYGVSVFAPDRAATFFAVWMPATMIFVTVRPGDEIGPAADRLGRHVLGVAWLSLLPMLARLRMLPDGLAWVFVVLGISWLSDTGAYFAGRSLGKHPLYARISPKKTVEGMVGGMLTATVGVGVITRIGLPEVGWLDVLVLGLLGSAISVLGDLAESLLKRSYGVKDSGTILPGHGGLLDRIDSVLFVGAFVYGYATFITGA